MKNIKRNIVYVGSDSYYKDTLKLCNTRINNTEPNLVKINTLKELGRKQGFLLLITMDELYEAMGGKKLSSALLDMPSKSEVNETLLQEYKSLLTLRSDVLKAIEVKRGEGVIKSSQEVALELQVTDEETKKVFDKLSNLEQTRLFIVSKVTETSLDTDTLEVSKVKVSASDGVKCERCWNKFEE